MKLNEAHKKVTLDELNGILATVSPREVIVVEAWSKANLNKGGKNEDGTPLLDEEGNKVVNQYFKTDAIKKKNIYYGQINVEYEKEVQDVTQDKDFKVSKPRGIKVGALREEPNGITLPMYHVEQGKAEWYLNGSKMTEEEYNTFVKPFKKPYKPNPTADAMGIRAPYVKNIISIAIGNDEYEISNPNVAHLND